MLKRYQVLLSDWLGAYAQFISEEYDLSFSESVRVLMCVGALQSIKEVFPKYKAKMTIGQVVRKIRSVEDPSLKEEVTHRLLSEGYFETRKAIEFRLAQKKRRKSK